MTVVPREPFSVYRKKQQNSSCGCHTHRSCFFLIPVPANIYIAHIFFWCKVFPLRAAVVCRNDKQADDSETARRKQKLQAWGYRKCHHHSVLLGDKLHTFSYAPTNIWQYFKALHKASRMNTWYVCLFVFLNEQSSNLSPSLNPFCL